MKYLVLFALMLLLVGCERDATPEAAIHSAMTSKSNASALQKETQQRVTEGEKIADGK